MFLCLKQILLLCMVDTVTFPEVYPFLACKGSLLHFVFVLISFIIGIIKSICFVENWLYYK
jgi:hypothetical protein